MASHVLQRKVDEVSLGINGNGVRMRHVEGPQQRETFPVALKDRYRAGFGGNVQALQARIVSEHIGILTYLIGGKNLHGGEVDHGERVIFFTGNEGHAIGCIEGDSMRVLDSGQRYAAGGPRSSGRGPAATSQILCGRSEFRRHAWSRSLRPSAPAHRT